MSMALEFAKKATMVLMVAVPPFRRAVNRYHLRLRDDGLIRFHGLYAKIFRRKLFERLMPAVSARWIVRFFGRDLIMPLDRDGMWLNWDLAVSITGHDVEVVRAFEEFLSCSSPPNMFFDVGANYGTHSILFRAVDVPVMSFEPNPTCFSFCKRVCDLNNLSVPTWNEVAIGDQMGKVDLVYPEQETWLGSISSNVVQTISKNRKMTYTTVPMCPLDAFFEQAVGKRLLIKIDVEGFELNVLRGATRILSDIRPCVIFESNDRTLRPDLYALLSRYKYGVHDLPNTYRKPLGLDDFIERQATNFLADPK